MSNLTTIIGSGGHAKVVFEAIRGVAPLERIQILDEFDISDSFWNVVEDGIKLIPNTDLFDLGDRLGSFHVAIGSNAVRSRMFQLSSRHGGHPKTVVHQQALVSATSVVEAGCFIAAKAIIAASSRIGKGAIVNHAASVDHDCEIGEFTHLAPGSVLCGGVTVGSQVLVGAGATVLPGVTIGDACVIGAGAVVRNDLHESGVYSGVPASLQKPKL